MTKDASKKVVYAALAGNLAIAATKLVAAFVTGSSTVLSEEGHVKYAYWRNTVSLLEPPDAD